MYADADYANNDNDRRSVSGIAVTSGGIVVRHASKTQRVISYRPQKLRLCVLFHDSLRPRRVGQV